MSPDSSKMPRNRKEDMNFSRLKENKETWRVNAVHDFL